MVNKQDVLNRQEFIERVCDIVNVISKNGKNCCFAIDGVWGSGKSFILERVEEQLKITQLEETNTERYFVFHYDCWEYDYYDEPIIAIIAAMLDATEKEVRVLPEGVENAIHLSWSTVKTTLMQIVKELCKNKIGIDLVEVAQNVLDQNDKRREASFDEMFGFRKALEKTREGIREIAKEKTIVIFVDELDRCLPTYTIKVLERLHHIFADIDNVIVIIAMDKRQIEHMVEQIYGVSDIDVDRYLRKFVSFELLLEKGKASDYLAKYDSFASLFDVGNEERDEIDTFLSDIMIGIDIRTQEKIFNKAEIIYRLVYDDEIRDSSILVFEILLLVLYEKQKKNNLKWILENGHFINEENQLGKDYYALIKGYTDAIKKGTYHCYGDGDYYDIRETVVGRAFFLLACMEYEYKEGGRCGKYHYGDDVDELVAMVKKLKPLLCI